MLTIPRRAALTSILILLFTTTALAAYPKLPAKFTGGNGRGLPVRFNLDRRGKVTYAAAAFVCRNISGVAVASSQKPAGTLTRSGKLTISYSQREEIGTVQVKWTVTFPSRTTAKGTITFSNTRCHAPKVYFTASSS